MNELGTRTQIAIDTLINALYTDAEQVVKECRDLEGFDKCDMYHGLETATSIKVNQLIRENFLDVITEITEQINDL